MKGSLGKILAGGSFGAVVSGSVGAWVVAGSVSAGLVSLAKLSAISNSQRSVLLM